MTCTGIGTEIDGTEEGKYCYSTVPRSVLCCEELQVRQSAQSGPGKLSLDANPSGLTEWESTELLLSNILVIFCIFWVQCLALRWRNGHLLTLINSLIHLGFVSEKVVGKVFCANKKTSPPNTKEKVGRKQQIVLIVICPNRFVEYQMSWAAHFHHEQKISLIFLRFRKMRDDS